MDIKGRERIVIVKPVASRPCSSFRSFRELHAGAINSSPSISPQTGIPAIRPKTFRIKQTFNSAPSGVVSSQANISGRSVSNPSDKILKSDGVPVLVHKPLAKLVSERSLSLLQNMGNLSANHQQTLTSSDAEVEHQKIKIPNKHNLRCQSCLHASQNIPSHMEMDQTTKPIKMPSQNLEDDPKSLPPASRGSRSPYDAYNWRKYGQKKVKGSEYPLSYYKCTHPSCPVKKKVERSFDRQIAEIVYKGEHNHSKPEPRNRNSLGTQGLGLVSDGTVQYTNDPIGNHRNESETGLSAQTTYQGKSVVPYQPGPGVEGKEGSKGLVREDGEPRSKRRRKENQSNEASIAGEAIQDPQIVVQNSTDSEILGDGFGWRKYGQKVVKGNPYPRSYYRCTSIKCNVRKLVERASDDPKTFITTYEGKHNHDMPVKIANPGVLESNSFQ